MTALLMPAPLNPVLNDADTALVTTPGAGTRVRPRRTERSAPGRDARRTRAGDDPRHARIVVPVAEGSWACRLENPRPRVTIVESSVTIPTPARGWQLTERGWAVVLLGMALVFGSALALMVVRFLSITAG